MIDQAKKILERMSRDTEALANLHSTEADKALENLDKKDPKEADKYRDMISRVNDLKSRSDISGLQSMLSEFKMLMDAS